MAFELIDHPEKLNDKNTWVPFKKMILAVLKDQDNDYHQVILCKCYPITYNVVSKWIQA
jgi:hypothetical protein